jgi:hypothetical protein
MSARTSPSVRLYRALLLLFPADFRREYGEEAARVFGELHVEARARGLAAIATLWGRALCSTARHGLAERVNRPRGGPQIQHETGGEPTPWTSFDRICCSRSGCCEKTAPTRSPSC